MTPRFNPNRFNAHRVNIVRNRLAVDCEGNPPIKRNVTRCMRGNTESTRTVGAEEYEKYLQSETWKIIRAQRLALDNYECVLCGKEAQHVHHRRYPKSWGTETIKDLVCLCNLCHLKHHDKK